MNIMSILGVIAQCSGWSPNRACDSVAKPSFILLLTTLNQISVCIGR
jgi:hypothetical protein